MKCIDSSVQANITHSSGVVNAQVAREQVANAAARLVLAGLFAQRELRVRRDRQRRIQLA